MSLIFRCSRTIFLKTLRRGVRLNKLIRQLVVLRPFIGFQASYRGRLLPDHPILNRREISQIGLMVSDKQKGGFSLEFKRIGFLDK